MKRSNLVLDEQALEEAIALYRLARRQGLTVRSSVDCIIAACAIRHDLVVLHADPDYTAIATVSALREQPVTSDDKDLHSATRGSDAREGST